MIDQDPILYDYDMEVFYEDDEYIIKQVLFKPGTEDIFLSQVVSLNDSSIDSFIDHLIELRDMVRMGSHGTTLH
jgi:hypothetical protein